MEGTQNRLNASRIFNWNTAERLGKIRTVEVVSGTDVRTTLEEADLHLNDSGAGNQEWRVMVTLINKVEWDTSLETGIEVVDEQHRQYFVLLNNYLEKAAESPVDRDEFFDLLEKLDFLRQYAREHFSTEELLMQEAGFPGYDAHRWEHQYFEHHVGELFEQLKTDGFSLDLANDVNYYIIEWFVEHIRQVDMELVEFLHDKAGRDGALSALLRKLYTALFGKN